MARHSGTTIKISTFRESRTTIRSAHAVAERNTLQPPIELVVPDVVHAGKIGEIVPLLQADQRALVRAAVDHRMDARAAQRREFHGA